MENEIVDQEEEEVTVGRKDLEKVLVKRFVQVCQD